MEILLVFFLGIAGLLWLSTFGYPALLLFIAWTRKQANVQIEDWPEIAVIIPTLNEEGFIQAKIADLEEIDYPTDRLSAIVIDGGSFDKTPALVRQEIERGARIRLVVMNDARNKFDQVIKALELVENEYVVFTDADTRLEPSCLKELIRALLADPLNAVVGAKVKPASRLPEELIHWGLLNSMWWIEGEALSAAGFSGVCYAIRRNSLKPVFKDLKAEDIHLSLLLSSSGQRVRLCNSAVATELRVPQTAREFLDFRRKRGADYASALRTFKTQEESPLPWKIVRAVRLWQFGAAPWLGIALAAIGLALLPSRYWAHLLITFLALLIPALGGIWILNRDVGKTFGWRKLMAGLVRYPALLSAALLTLNKSTVARVTERSMP